MKLFRTLVTEKKKRGDKTPAKTRPILIVGENVADARDQLSAFWGKDNYKWTRPNMIADFNPK